MSDYIEKAAEAMYQTLIDADWVVVDEAARLNIHQATQSALAAAFASLAADPPEEAVNAVVRTDSYTPAVMLSAAFSRLSGDE